MRLILKDSFLLYKGMCVHTDMCKRIEMSTGAAGEVRGVRFPRDGVTDDGEALMWVLKLNLSPLEEQQVFLNYHCAISPSPNHQHFSGFS